jgi:hypothetical protein
MLSSKSKCGKVSTPHVFLVEIFKISKRNLKSI